MRLFLFLYLILSIIATVFGGFNEIVNNIKPKFNKITENYTDKSDLDVYYQKSYFIRNNPVVVYVHGGGWCEGSKDKEAFMGEFFQRNGYVAVLINYRLYPETENIDDMVEDIYNALQWTIKNIGKYGGNPNNISLMGHSAGAHLSTLTTVKAALGMKVNNITLNPIHLSNLVSLNGRQKLDEGEDLTNGINELRKLCKTPGLEFLDLYAEAREHLLVGKSGFDQSKILKDYRDKSFLVLGAKKFTFVECDEDTVDPLGLADPMIQQLKRVVTNVSINHKIFKGDHMYILDGIKNGDKEIEREVLGMIKEDVSLHLLLMYNM